MASVQVMFNGPGFNLEWLVMKAEHELATTMKELTRFMENAANLSTTLAHMADWALAFKPSALAHCTSLSDIRTHVETQCPKAALFLDIANEYKHADRRTPSEKTAKVLQYLEAYPAATNLSHLQNGMHIFGSMNDGAQVAVLTPKIRDQAGNEFLFKDCAHEAIQWWKSVI